MGEAVELLSKLQVTDSNSQKEKIILQLIKCLNAPNDGGTEMQETVLHHEAMNSVLSILHEEGSGDNETLQIACAQLVAELAKNENLREPLVDTGITSHLLRHLRSSNMALATQACRALGNMCFDNDQGRIAVDKNSGMAVIVDVLTQHIHSTEERAARLRVIVCGFLLNLTNNCEILQERALEKNVVEHLNECVRSHIDDEDLTNMALLSIGSITESDSGKTTAVRSGLMDTFKRLLDRHQDDHITELTVDLLSALLEPELGKEKAAENGLTQSLVDIVESDWDNPELVKMASDVLVSILVGDNSMEKLYASGEGSLFLRSLEWLSSEKDILRTLGTMAVGNFARRDSYCQQLVEKGVVSKLLHILQSTGGQESNLTLEHAVLSSLRNLAIPVSNKPALLEAGVLEVCLSLVHSQVMAVVFKLLGVMRMLTEGQETAATRLGQEQNFLERLTEWCGVEAHAGVKGEATRLMASLVKNSRSSVVVQNLIRVEGLNHLVAMATSEHVVMQNEAIIALTIICTIALGEAAHLLKEAGLTDTLLALLKDNNLPGEVVSNVLTLLKALSATASPAVPAPCALLACTGLLSDVRRNLQEEIITSGVVDLVRSIGENHLDDKVRRSAVATLNLLEESMPCT